MNSALGAALRPADPADHFKADDVGNERKLHLFGLFGRTGAKAPYRYDFGDIWKHAVPVNKHAYLVSSSMCIPTAKMDGLYLS